jgi:Domain of unknown function (DUF4760)
MTTSLILSIVGVIISLGATGISVFLIIRQIRFQRHANEVPIAISLGQEYRSDEFQLAQSYVIELLAKEHNVSLGVTDLPMEARTRVLKVVNFFTWLAGLVFFDIVDEEFIVGLIGSRINNAWEKLEPYILQERQTKSNPDYLVFYEDLVCRIRQYGLAVDKYYLKLKRINP